MSTPARRRPPEPVRRDVVDHALARRALLRQVLGGGLFATVSPYEVEVCRRCGWNHLVRSWRTGTPGTAPARRPRKSDLV
jgi:hypothetical protein